MNGAIAVKCTNVCYVEKFHMHLSPYTIPFAFLLFVLPQKYKPQTRFKVNKFHSIICSLVSIQDFKCNLKYFQCWEYHH